MKGKRLKCCEVLGVRSVHVLHAATVDALDDACLLRILAFLDPMPGKLTLVPKRVNASTCGAPTTNPYQLSDPLRIYTHGILMR